jgi:hypothetical protein
MMMQMLEAGGIELLTDHVRRPNEDNPKGYYEYQPVKRLAKDNSWLNQAEGKAVKVVSPLLYDLPAEHTYKVIFMKRPLDEILASQARMLDRSGRPQDTDDAEMKKHFEQHLANLYDWLTKQSNMNTLYCPYPAVLESPLAWARKIEEFLGLNLNIRDMANQADYSLHRQKCKI